MPSFRRRTRGFRSGRKARRLEWTGAAVDGFGVLTAGSVGRGYVLLPSQTVAYTDPTLVRIRGEVTVFHQTVAGVLVDGHGAAGIIRWSDPDDTVPAIADSPNPFDRPDLDWIWHTYFHFLGGGTLASSGDRHGIRIEIDSRAMRRLGQADGLMFCITNAHAANDILYSWGARVLLKE